jgi:acylaminoacyl-peptidase
MPQKSTRRRRPRAGGGPVSIEDLRHLVVPSAVRFDPIDRNGTRRVVFVRKHVCKRAEARMDLWTAPLDGGEPARFTTSGRDGAPAFSPDGERLCFVSRRAGVSSKQLYVMPSGGGEAERLTSLPEGTIGAWKWSPDGTTIALSFRETPEGFREEDRKRRSDSSASEPARIIDDMWYRLDGDGYFGGARFKLLTVDARTGESTVLYEGDRLGTFDFAFSPDGKTLAVTTNRHKRAALEPKHAELVLIDVASGRLTPVDGQPAGPKACPSFSPDGKRVAYAGREGDDPLYSTENLGLWVTDLTGKGKGKAKELTAGLDVCLLAASIGDTSDADFAPWLRFAPDGKRVLFRLGHGGETHVASVSSRRGGDLRVHTSGSYEHDPSDVARADGGVGFVAMTISSPTKPPEVAVLNLADDSVRALTRLNASFIKGRAISKPRSTRVKAEDGNSVHVRTLLPPGHKSGSSTRYPAVLMIHGGPHAQYGSGFFHEMQTLAGHGFAVVYPNPRGSKGYGRDFCAAIRGAWGGDDWTDVRAVIDWMLEHKHIDPERIAISGGSYGGYMVNHAIGHTNVFKAAVSDRCVSNLVSHLGNSDYYQKPGRYFRGNFWDDIDEAWRQSPIRHAGKVKTPTLIIHSEGDLRCNIEQSEQVFAALQIRGVASRFVRYPRSTSHGMSRNGPVDLREHRLRQIVEWIEHYTR